jgi:hypothetical protein
LRRHRKTPPIRSAAASGRPTPSPAPSATAFELLCPDSPVSTCICPGGGVAVFAPLVVAAGTEEGTAELLLADDDADVLVERRDCVKDGSPMIVTVYTSSGSVSKEKVSNPVVHLQPSKQQYDSTLVVLQLYTGTPLSSIARHCRGQFPLLQSLSVLLRNVNQRVASWRDLPVQVPRCVRLFTGSFGSDTQRPLDRHA